MMESWASVLSYDGLSTISICVVIPHATVVLAEHLQSFIFQKKIFLIKKVGASMPA